MSKVNLDVTERLDITCRRGDTFQLTLTLKDASGTALSLATDDYKFLMQVRQQGPSRRSVARVVPSPTGSGDEAATIDGGDDTVFNGIVIGSNQLGVKGPVNFAFNDIDDSGNVTVFLSARDMRSVPAGRYRYDFQYVVGSTEKTVLEGRFTVNSDISKAL